MPTIVYYCIILLSGALSGWLISRAFIGLLFWPHASKQIAGIRCTGILPALKPVLAESAGKLASSIDLKAALSNNHVIEKLMPEMETHIDEFLKVRLKEAFPLLSNFMGEKTLLKFRATFLEEVSAKLPGILENYSAKLAGDFDVKHLIAQKIEQLDIAVLESIIKEKARKQLILLQIAAVGLGMLAAILQIILTRILQ